MTKPYLLHPAVVHFPLALLVTGLGMSMFENRRGREWVAGAVSWLLWLGTASAWVAAGLGILAAKTAPHVPPAWETLADHQALGYWSAGLFTALSVWRRFWPERWPRVFVLAWIVAATVLLATAYHGGELVFTYNMGTAASQE